MSHPKPWSAERFIDQDQAVALIEEQFPNLKPITITFLGEGWDNVVYRVNETYVFRFPRRQLAVGFLNTEYHILPQLQNSLPLPIPTLAWYGKPTKIYPWPFIGYHYLPGQSACAAKLSISERTNLAKPLAQFLSALHAITQPQAIALGVQQDPFDRLAIAKRKAKTQENITRLTKLRLPIDCDRLVACLRSVEPIIDTGAKVLIHGDIYARHLLIDEQRNLSGIIDWGDACIANRAIDLAIIFSFLPPEARTTFLNVYGAIDDQTAHLARFRALDHTITMVLYSHDIQDQDLLTETLLGLQLITTT
jgi:aminoglycoside phosphotransferase (APT) family kinase protein